MNEETLARYQKVAEHAYNAHLAAYSEQSKWILASLLAVNGGALIALGQSANISLGLFDPWAARVFVIGCIMAIVSGAAARRHSLVVTESMMRFLTVGTNEERLDALEAAKGREKRFAMASDAAASLSGLCFVVGVIFAGSHIPALLPHTSP